MRAVALFCLALFATAVPAAAFPARVQSCHDGDTCRVITGQGVIKVRLAEIDAPEIDQPYGTAARAVLCSMVCGRDVDVEPRGTSYDRIVGLIRINGLDTSEAMVRAGAAWDYPQYDLDPMMPSLQRAARAGQLGLWGNPSPIPPWEWRHNGMGRVRSP